MNKILSLLASFGLLFGGPAAAQDSFDREFSKFDKDFERLNSWKAETPASKKLKHRPAVAAPAAAPDASGTTTPLHDDAASPLDKAAQEPAVNHGGDAAPVAPTEVPPVKTSALPKGAKVERLARNDRLGNQISDPAMRKKVQDLYKRSDVVVQQYVLPTN